MRIVIKQYTNHAGKWIYKGFKSAFEFLGFETVAFCDRLPDDIRSTDVLMLTDADVYGNIEKLSKAYKVFLYIQPTSFPQPWGSHPNFRTTLNKQHIYAVNQLDNVIMWNFGRASREFFEEWKGEILYLPLAYDSINYKYDFDELYQYDVCFVGGWVNNGFNEKRTIMLKTFSKFRCSNLKCGFFVDADLSHRQEQKILSSSKVCLNLHDKYQRKLGFDTNERTFKALGLNGVLVSDYIREAYSLFGEIIFFGNDDDELLDKVRTLVDNDNLGDVRARNKEGILKNHTYLARVHKLLERL